MRDPTLDRAAKFCAILTRSRSTGSRLNDKPGNSAQEVAEPREPFANSEENQMLSPMTKVATPAMNPGSPRKESALPESPVQEPPTPDSYEVPAETSPPPLRRSNR